MDKYTNFSRDCQKFLLKLPVPVYNIHGVLAAVKIFSKKRPKISHACKAAYSSIRVSRDTSCQTANTSDTCHVTCHFHQSQTSNCVTWSYNSVHAWQPFRAQGDALHLYSVPGSLIIAGGRGFHLLLSKRWNLDGIFFLLFCLTNPALACHKINQNTLIDLDIVRYI
jgi:hypothetical protein